MGCAVRPPLSSSTTTSRAPPTIPSRRLLAAAWARPRLLALGQAKAAASWPGAGGAAEREPEPVRGPRSIRPGSGSSPAAWLIVAVSALGVLCVDGSMVTLSCGAYAARAGVATSAPTVAASTSEARISCAAVRIFSGIQPTGRKHLGNYIGAITQYVAGQDRGDPAIYCIVDLHAITVPYDPAELRERVHDTTAILLAAGLDPERCILFRQGDVREHTELTWLLTSVTAVGELNRMHQFRDKSAGQRDLVSAGILFYPVLMAADVLAYRAEEVPVGEDQREHVELMRDVAERFNARFGEVLAVPAVRLPRSARACVTCRRPSARCRPPAAPSRAPCSCSTSPTSCSASSAAP